MQVPNFEKLGDGTRGLPDHCFLDGNGRESWSRLMEVLGLPRKMRTERKLFDCYLSRRERAFGFATVASHYRGLGKDILLEGDSAASWEAQVFSRFDNGWHLREDSALGRVGRLDGSVSQKLLDEFARVIRPQKRKTGVSALKTKSTSSVGRVNALDVLGKSALETVFKALDELPTWDEKDFEQRRALADVVFAGFSLFGAEILRLATGTESRLLEFYGSVLGGSACAQTTGSDRDHAVESDVIDVGGQHTDVFATAESETGAPHAQRSIPESPRSLKELYARISTIAAQAEKTDESGDPAQEIRDLLNVHLERLISLVAKLAPAEVAAIVDRFIAELTAMLGPMGLQESELLPLLLGLERAWRLALTNALLRDESEAWFRGEVESRRRLMPDLHAKFEIGRRSILDASTKIASLESELAEAKVTAKPALKAKLHLQRALRDEGAMQLDEFRIAAITALSPSGIGVDDVEELAQSGNDGSLDTGGVAAATLLALQAAVNKFEEVSGSLTPRTEIDAGQFGQVLNEYGALEEAEPPLNALGESSVVEIEVVCESQTPGLPTTGADLSEASVNQNEVGAASTDDVDSSIPQAPLAIRSLVELESPPARHDVTGITTITEALKHFDYYRFAEDAARSYRLAADQYSTVPSTLAEAIALHWVEAGHLNVAAQVLKDASASNLVENVVLDPALLRLAFYGMNVWPKDQETLGHMQRELNLVNLREIEEQLERKPSGKVVPYLLVAATLQTALFAGNETSAPTLLKLASGHFDGPLGQLINNTVEFTTRGGRVDWETLRNLDTNEVGLAATRVRNEVNAWVDRNEQRTNLWHTLRLALKQCIDEPLIANAVAAIRKGEKGSIDDVRAFAQTYDTPIATRELLDRLAAQVRADYPHQDQIDTSAYRSFERQMAELVAISRSWLLEVAPADVKTQEVAGFLERWRTQLNRSIALLSSHEQQADLEHRAGCVLLRRALGRLQGGGAGDSRVIWKHDQTEAAFVLPAELFELTAETASATLRLEWFASQLPANDWLRAMTNLTQTNAAYRLQLLLLSERISLGEPLESDLKDVRREIDGALATVRQSIETLKTLSGQALMADLIDDTRHQYFAASAEANMEELASLPAFASSAFISERVTSLSGTLRTILDAQAERLEAELNQALTLIRSKLGGDAVPPAWETRARAALDARSLTVVQELLSQLQTDIDRGEAVKDVQLDENPDLQIFLSVEKELAEILGTTDNPREAGARVIDAAPGRLPYNVRQHDFKSAIELLVEQRKIGARGRKALLDLQTYSGISKILDFLGFSVLHKSPTTSVLERCEFTQHGDFRRLKVEISRPKVPKGFPLFENGSKDSVGLNLMFVKGEWSLAGFKNSIEQDGAPATAVLLVGTALDSADRNAFASLCKERRCTVFLVDPVVLAYVATVQERQLEAFLRVAAPWTFYMPYHAGDTRLPAPPEMRFGREGDAIELARPRGAALVYGGRQLGKTTLLHSAVAEFEKQSTNHRAFFIRMDGGLEHVEHRDGGDVKERVFSLILARLVESRVMSPNPQKSASQEIAAEFAKPDGYSVLVCLDEIDPILNADANKDFPLFRSLAGLVNDPHHRFKVVIAGLQNVNRFQNLPNVPLEQLGRPLPVTIMDAVDARRLIQLPLASLGYRFSSPTLIDRIMAFTNRHPGLLHIFCAELVQLLANRRGICVGDVVIRDVDLESIETNPSVQKLSRERFDMTLNLDKRYLLIVYGLIEKHGRNIGSFSVKQALDVAKSWAPEQFQGMNESGFEALLDELVGLGVLKHAQNPMRHYALRNQSVLQLVGASGDIEHKLLVAARDVEHDLADALTCHPTTAGALNSPLSLADEKMVLKAQPAVGAPLYSVSIVMGSDALGLTNEAVIGSFNAISEFENGKELSKYATRVLPNVEGAGLTRFNEYLDTAISMWAGGGPAVVLVPIDVGRSISVLMDLIDLASEKAAAATVLKHRLRIVFLLKPKAMWLWISNPAHTTMPSDLGGVVQLQRWTRHACQGLLEQLGMTPTVDEATQLHGSTEGWYASLMRFVELRKRKSTASNLGDLKDFKKLTDLPSREFNVFVEQTGVNIMPWSMRLARLLNEYGFNERFTLSDVRDLVSEEDFGTQLDVSMSESVVRWWLALRVIDPIDVGARVRSQEFVEYRFTPALQRAVATANMELST